LFRLNYGTHMYTRWAVPVDENQTTMFYFHTTRPARWLNRVYEICHWHMFHNWAMNKNFSEQDARGAIEAYHDTEEYLSPTDMQTIEWRKLLLTARGLELEVPPEFREPERKSHQPEAATIEEERALAPATGA